MIEEYCFYCISIIKSLLVGYVVGVILFLIYLRFFK